MKKYTWKQFFITILLLAFLWMSLCGCENKTLNNSKMISEEITRDNFVYYKEQDGSSSVNTRINISVNDDAKLNCEIIYFDCGKELTDTYELDDIQENEFYELLNKSLMNDSYSNKKDYPAQQDGAYLLMAEIKIGEQTYTIHTIDLSLFGLEKKDIYDIDFEKEGSH